MVMLNAYQKIAAGYVSLLLAYWTILYLSSQTSSIYNYLFSFLFSLIPLLGGLFAMFGSKRVWNGLKSYVGKGVFFISLGLFLWGSGSMVWSYYNFFEDIPAPYPSFADLGFAPSVLFYGLGTVYLSKATGAKFGLRNKYARVFAFIAPLLIFTLSYHFLINVAREGVFVTVGDDILKIVLDVIYPFGDFIALSIAVVISGLSFHYLGGKYIVDILSILIGLAVMFVADFVFSYTTTVGTFYNGNFGDLIFTIGLFLLTYGVLGFCTLKVTENSQQI
jgi:hypothetical protein